MPREVPSSRSVPNPVHGPRAAHLGIELQFESSRSRGQRHLERHGKLRCEIVQSDGRTVRTDAKLQLRRCLRSHYCAQRLFRTGGLTTTGNCGCGSRLPAARSGLPVRDGGIAPKYDAFTRRGRVHRRHVEEDLGRSGRRRPPACRTAARASAAIEREVMSGGNRVDLSVMTAILPGPAECCIASRNSQRGHRVTDL